jgi:fido (protein-threonine AMPylation protein)
VQHKCQTCQSNQKRLLAPGVQHNCGIKRLCDIVETRLAELKVKVTGLLTIEDCWQLTEQVRDGHQAALARLDTLPWSHSPASFMAILRLLHDTIFQGTGLPFVGRFRQVGDEGVCYGQGRNERQAIDASEIAGQLATLFTDTLGKIDYASVDRRGISRIFAVFLEEYFRIHPFHDGNGRVARLILKKVVALTPGFVIDKYDIKGHAYLHALEYAHKCADSRQTTTGEYRDPYQYLAKWLQQQITTKPPDLAEPQELPQ